MTAIFARPLTVRLAVAHLWTATQSVQPERCDPGNSVDRMLFDTGTYGDMWEDITSFYESTGLDQATDAEILQHVSVAMRMERQLGAYTIAPDAMRDSIALWERYGWTHYETKRAGKLRAMRQYTMPAVALVGLCFGVVLPRP